MPLGALTKWTSDGQRESGLTKKVLISVFCEFSLPCNTVNRDELCAIETSWQIWRPLGIPVF